MNVENIDIFLRPRRTYLTLIYVFLLGAILAIQKMIEKREIVAPFSSPVPASKSPKKRPDIPSLPNVGAEARNPEITEEGYELWEGDMILTQDQIESLGSSTESRKAIGEQHYRWPNGYVPYEIEPSSEQEREIILTALDFWMTFTCLHFEEIPVGSKGHHLIFTRKDGCYSHVGRSWFLFPDGQTISIGEGCERMGTILHEVGHAIGFYHQQSRPDRNEHVAIFLKNVFPKKISNFDVHKDANFHGVPYDLGSLMHYGADYFSMNGKNTIVPLDPTKQFEIGQRDSLSFYDIQLANFMYKCSDQCNKSHPICLNGGYVDHQCECRCPPLTTGLNCEIIIPLPDLVCGGEITTPQIITSPKHPSNYPKGCKCVWRIEAPKNHKVVASFKAFELLYRHIGRCPWDSLEIRINSKHEGDIFCGTELQGVTVESYQQEMYILFKSLYDWKKGFNITITFKEFITAMMVI